MHGTDLYMKTNTNLVIVIDKVIKDALIGTTFFMKTPNVQTKSFKGPKMARATSIVSEEE